MSKSMTFNFSGYSGKDVWLAILPYSWQTKRIAKAWLKTLTTPDGVKPNVDNTPLLISTPWGCYRIVDLDGNTKPAARESFKY